MRMPALLYGLVLPFTLWRAVSCFFGSELSTLQSMYLSLGALSLYVGDVEFAARAEGLEGPPARGGELAGDSRAVVGKTGRGAREVLGHRQPTGGPRWHRQLNSTARSRRSS